ncbi:MAG: sugar ABC transporter permease [Planctomycetota bacterium]|nr:sugar ABC transporter permease [Planctomycetota bacterium]
MARRNNLAGWVLVSPVVVGLLVFTLYPFLASLALSFCEYDLFPPPRGVGAWNYETMFTRDPLVWKSLTNVLYYTALAVPLGIVMGVGLALLLDAKIKGLAVYRTLFFLPSIVPVVATSVLWIWLLNPQIGLVNTLLRLVGIEGPTWLASVAWSKPSLVFMGVWGVGGSMLIYLAGLKDIPASLYEAAVVDGANAWQRVRYVTLPMLTPVIFFNLVMGMIGAFQYFTQAYVMTQGGPLDSTRFYALHLFFEAFQYLKMGYASAMAWVLFIIVVGVTALLFRSQHRWVHYGR